MLTSNALVTASVLCVFLPLCYALANSSTLISDGLVHIVINMANVWQSDSIRTFVTPQTSLESSLPSSPLELLHSTIPLSSKALFSASLPQLLVLLAGASFLTYLFYQRFVQSSVYLVNFTTFTPPDSWMVSRDFYRQQMKVFGFSDDNIAFASKLLERNGVGNQTYFPPGILAPQPDLSLPRAREEAECVMFGCLDQLFKSTHLRPTDIDILIVNCSLFNPTPSLTSMIVNRYKMREDIQSYNLSGMGCSAGVIAVHLAKDLLKVHKNARAVIVSFENITQNIYLGSEKSMLISNTLFRCGGAAILLSNRKADRSKAKYKLEHTVRTHLGHNDEAYKAVFQDIDATGHMGVRLDRSLMRIAAKALERNITKLGPHILPYSEQIRYGLNMLHRMYHKRFVKSPATPPSSPSASSSSAPSLSSASSASSSSSSAPAPYVPVFNKGIQHFCIHAGGRGVIDAVQTALKLSEDNVAASRAVLERYGNTSSSSIWYELQFIEKSGNLRSGQRVWQMAFGSGFKCNSAVWKAL